MNLQENINRIKSMMKSINEDEYTPPQLSGRNMKIVNAIISSFKSKPKIDDSDYDIDGGWFVISLGGNFTYFLEYTFTVDITSHSSYTPGTYEDPPEGEATEFELGITDMKLYVDDELVYEGPDVTDFLNIKTQLGRTTGEDVLYNHVDDKIQEIDADSDYSDY